MEGLSCSLKNVEASESIHGSRISCAAPPISHLFLADDMFSFFCANTNETQSIKHILNNYERYSGQVVNYQKSAIFYIVNVQQDRKQEISRIWGFWMISTSKYLGLPSLVGRSKKSVFNFVREKVCKKLQSWSNKLLSRDGKAVLIKSVVQSIPTYTISCFLLPKSMGQEIEMLMNGF